MHAPVSEKMGPEEPFFQNVEAGFDPIQETVTDTERKAYLQRCFSEFKLFSDSLGKENK